MTVQGHGWDDNTGYPAFRNLIINGGMSVAQRGTSTASITTGGYLTCDRWAGAISSLGTWTNTQENDGPIGINKSWKWLCTTANASPAASAFALVRQGVEGQNLQQLLKGSASAKSSTVSFWVKSNVTGTYIVYLNDNPNSRIIAASYTINASATWERKTVTFAGDTTGALTNDASAGIYLSFLLGIGSNYTSAPLQTSWSTGQTGLGTGQVNVAAAASNYWQITGVQWEVGSVATPFEFEPFETTLRKCQRYFCKSYDSETTPGTITQNGVYIFGGSTNGGGNMAIPITFPVEMRALPSTYAFYNRSTGASTWNYDRSGASGTFAPTTDAQGKRGFRVVVGAGAGWVTASALGHWTASAEL